MNSDDVKINLIWAAALVVAVISVPWSISSYYASVNKAAMENGYEHGVLPGRQEVYWVKKNEAEKP